MKPDSAEPMITTGSPGLDVVLRGGLPANRMYLLEGNPGTGKTTLALRFLLEGAKQGEKTLYVTLSETKEELEGVARSHGWALDGVELYEMETADQDLKKGDEYTFFHPTEVELGEMTRAICEKVKQVEPQRVVFDSLSEMRLMAGDSLRYRRQILDLKRFFSGRRCSVFLLDDHTAAHEDLLLQSVCHGVIRLENNTTPYGSSHRRLQVVKLRGVKFFEGQHDMIIEKGGVTIFPHLIASEERSKKGEARGVGHAMKSGIPELDAILGGGLEFGTSTLVMGPAGCGKSTITMQYAEACAKAGKTVCMYLFEEGRQAALQRAAGLGMSIQKYIDEGKIIFHQIDPAILTPGEFSARIRRGVEESHAEVVVIDSLNGYINALPTEQFLLLQMHEILTYLSDRGVLTMIVLSQRGFMATNMIGPVDVSYLADTVIVLRYFEAGGAVRKAISVVKKRTGAHENKIREFALSSKGIRIGRALDDFRGVLTGVPTYFGKSEEMLASDEPK